MSALFAERSSATPTLTLVPHTVAVPALASQVRPGLVLPEAQTRDLMAAARRWNIHTGGNFSAGPAGVQVWSGPFDGPNDQPGSAEHLGSVDWTYDTPVRDCATVHRTIVTAAGVAAGESTASIMARVLALVGLPTECAQLRSATPPVRDPFRSRV